jgi:hypothetical protein
MRSRFRAGIRRNSSLGSVGLAAFLSASRYSLFGYRLVGRARARYDEMAAGMFEMCNSLLLSNVD